MPADGLVVGPGFIQGGGQDALLTIELMFLALTASPKFGGSGPSKPLVVAALGLSLLLTVGAVASVGLPAGLPGLALTGLYAFGLVALLHFVTKEPLVEAHERPDTQFVTAVFFVGFSFMVTLDRLID